MYSYLYKRHSSFITTYQLHFNFMEFNMNENFRDKQAAQYLQVSVSTIWLYAKQGKLHPVRLSPRVTIFKKSDLDALIDSMTVVAS